MLHDNSDDELGAETYNFEGVYSADLCALVTANPNFRSVLFTADHVQLVAMCVTVDDGGINRETHEDVAQTFFVVAGVGRLIYNNPQLGPGEVYLNRGTVAIVPAGTRHRVVNDSQTDALKLFTLYSNPLHAVDLVQPARTDPDREYS